MLARFLKNDQGPFEPPVPPPAGWRGEPGLHPENVNAFDAAFRRSLVPVLLFVVLWVAGWIFIPSAIDLQAPISLLFVLGLIPNFMIGLYYSRMKGRYFGKARHQPLLFQSVLIGSCSLVVLGPMSVRFIDRPGFGILFLLPLVIVFAFSALAVLLHATELGSLMCRVCRYDLSEHESSVCPECGRTLSGNGITVIHKKPRTKVKAAIVVCIALFFLTMLAPIPLTARPGITRGLPAPFVAMLGESFPSLWEELAKRQLTPAQAASLAETAVDQVNRGRPMTWACEFIEIQIERGFVADDVINRYFGNFVSLSLVQSRPAFAGELARVRIEAEHAISSRVLPLRIFVRGYDSDREQLKGGSVGNAISLLAIGPHANHADYSPEISVICEFTPAAPGTMTIESTVVLFAANATQHTIEWHEDGSYTITPEPNWHELRNLSFDLNVRERP